MARGRPTAKKKPPPTVDPRRFGYWVAVGGPNHLGTPERFDTEGKARKRAKDAFEAMIAWCRSYNRAGEATLVNAMGELNTTSFTMARKQVSAMFDEHTGTTVTVTVWHGPGNTFDEPEQLL